MKSKVRPAAKAGSWYEGSRSALLRQINSFYDAVPRAKATAPVRALISPHAGYTFSGQTAAHGFKSLKGAGIRRVMVLAPSHFMHFEGASLPDVDFYETPLGPIPLDREACDTILESPLFTCQPRAHRDEHSLELQLPFLQVMLEEGFELIPILVGRIESASYESMAKTLRPCWDAHTLVVASSDFTHYGANFGYVPFKDRIPENLKNLDMGAVDKVLDLDWQGFLAYVGETGATICGRGPIALLLCMAQEEKVKAELLTYTTSGEMTHDFSNTVSYASICFTAAKE